MRDRYTITERLDHGGMAEVFRGVAESMEGFKKSVAIKRILPNLTKNQKFVVDVPRRGAAVAVPPAREHRPGVRHLEDADNAYFLVMEFVDGCNLKALIERQKQKNRRIEVAHAIYIMTECCKALQYAHFLEHPETNEPLGIVHRDISPPNILLSKNGEVKLVDFGLAKANSQIESTDQGVVKGKFSYLSPEAASGLEVDHRADVFAVGIILWELFTGRRLFYGDTDYQTVELVRQARVPSIAALNPEIEPELEAVVRKALARDPNERYQSAADLGDALDPVPVLAADEGDVARRRRRLVRDAQVEMMRKRSAEPKDSLIDALILDEMQKMTSLVDGEAKPARGDAEGSMSLDPSAFVDTSSWAGELGLNSAAAPARSRQEAARPAAEQAGARRADARAAGGGEVESLEQMLEPDRTGVHGKAREGHAVGADRDRDGRARRGRCGRGRVRDEVAQPAVSCFDVSLHQLSVVAPASASELVAVGASARACDRVGEAFLSPSSRRAGRRASQPRG